MAVRAGPVLLVSVTVHGALVAAVAHWLATPQLWPVLATDEDRATPAPAAAVRDVAAEPIEVAFLVDEPVGPVAPAPVAPAQHLAASAAMTQHTAASEATATSGAIATSTSTSHGAAEPVPGTGPGHGLMRMRGADLGLASESAERIAYAPGHERPAEPKVSGKLESQPGGRAVIYDRVTTVSVEPDGTAHFDDKKDIDLHFHLPIPKIWRITEIAKDAGDEIAEWYRDPYAQTRYGSKAEVARHLTAVPGACDSWGDTMCDDPLAPGAEKRARERKAVNGSIFGGMADITAYLQRKYVGDPYASRKLKLLDDTRDERVAMGMRHRAEQAARSAEIMTTNLQRLWARETNPVARRAALFELWDECGEDDAGQRARAVVIGWIRARLPAGSADAYTETELATLRTRTTSKAPFSPYE